MHLSLVAIIGIMLGADPTAPANSSLFETAQAAADRIPGTANRRYRLLRPKGFDLVSGRLYPLVVYLHGSGAKGVDNEAPLHEPLPALLATDAMRDRFECFVLVPQCRTGIDAEGRPNNWVKWTGQKKRPPAQWMVSDASPSDQLLTAMAALADVVERQPIDRERIYLTGVSMGGSGALYWMAQEPDRFAAVIAACGLSETVKANRTARTPLWILHGSDDPVAPIDRSRAMVDAVRSAGGAVCLTEYAGVGHGIAERAFTDNDSAVLTWLFQQRRRAR